MNTALLFSGGKDSMACLYIYRESLAQIYVIFVNTGKYYPEMLATVDRAKSMCPNWIEVHTDRDGQWAANGLPSDVVPVDWTVQGQMFTGKKRVTVQSYLQCCYENISAPAMGKIKELGCTHVIRGQRDEESHRSTVRNGAIVDGITYVHPIEEWTRIEVLGYLREQMGGLPDHFALHHSSMDCYDCTAYVKESADRIEYMQAKHPYFFDKFRAARDALNSAIQEAA